MHWKSPFLLRMGLHDMSARLHGHDMHLHIRSRRLGPALGFDTPIRQNGLLSLLSPFPTMKIVEVRHPLVQHKIGLMRNAALSTKGFRELANELVPCWPTRPPPTWTPSRTPCPDATTSSAHCRRQDHRGADPACRPGHAQRRAVADPGARVSVVGLQRDEETLQPVPYFERLTGRLEERDALILDDAVPAAR